MILHFPNIQALEIDPLLNATINHLIVDRHKKESFQKSSFLYYHCYSLSFRYYFNANIRKPYNHDALLYVLRSKNHILRTENYSHSTIITGEVELKEGDAYVIKKDHCSQVIGENRYCKVLYFALEDYWEASTSFSPTMRINLPIFYANDKFRKHWDAINRNPLRGVVDV